MKFLFLTCFVLLSQIVVSQNVTPLFSSKDSIIVDIAANGSLIYAHKFVKGNTMYSLARSFNLSPQELLAFNNIPDPTDIDINQLIFIKLNNDNIISSPVNIYHTLPANEIKEKGGLVPVYYTVKPKETLFRIARVYFNQDISNLKRINHLTENELSINQKLLIGYYYFGANKKPNISNSIPVDSTLTSIDSMSIKVDTLTLKKVDSVTIAYDKGPAFWQKDQRNNGKKYVLYNNAKPNTEIELYNPVTNRTVIAKVLDKIPENIYRTNISILLSPQVAKELGALDSRFFVEIKYYK
jgi:LysM repeat protein